MSTPLAESAHRRENRKKQMLGYACFLEVYGNHLRRQRAASIRRWVAEFDELYEKAATARAEGYREGLEAAAKMCDERFHLNDAIEPDDPMYGAALNRCAEAEECAFDIRNLAKEVK